MTVAYSILNFAMTTNVWSRQAANRHCMPKTLFFLREGAARSAAFACVFVQSVMPLGFVGERAGAGSTPNTKDAGL